MSASLELQDAVLAALKADPGVMTLVDDIYDEVPDSQWSGDRLAYISFGPHDVVDTGSECIRAGEHSLQLDCWTRGVGKVQAKRIVDAVARALDGRDDIVLATHSLAWISVGFRQVVDDPDGRTKHGIVRVTASIQER